MATTTIKDLKNVNNVFSLERIKKVDKKKQKEYDEKFEKNLLDYGTRVNFNLPDDYNIREDFVYKKKKIQEYKDLEYLIRNYKEYKYGTEDNLKDKHLKPYVNITIPQENKFEKIEIMNIEFDKQWKIVRIIDIDHMLKNKYKVISVSTEILVGNEKEPVEYSCEYTYDKDGVFTLFNDKIEKGTTDKVRKTMFKQNFYKIQMNKKHINKSQHLYLLMGYKRPVYYKSMEQNIYEKDFDKVSLVQRTKVVIKIQNNDYKSKEDKVYEIINNEGTWNYEETWKSGLNE